MIRTIRTAGEGVAVDSGTDSEARLLQAERKAAATAE